MKNQILPSFSLDRDRLACPYCQFAKTYPSDVKSVEMATVDNSMELHMMRHENQKHKTG